MPWCDTCSKFWNPSSMNADGSCPTCGRTLARPESPVSRARAEGDDGEADGGTTRTHPKAPWHFKLLMVALVAYLVWRIIDMIGWIAG